MGVFQRSLPSVLGRLLIVSQFGSCSHWRIEILLLAPKRYVSTELEALTVHLVSMVLLSWKLVLALVQTHIDLFEVEG